MLTLRIAVFSFFVLSERPDLRERGEGNGAPDDGPTVSVNNRAGWRNGVTQTARIGEVFFQTREEDAFVPGVCYAAGHSAERKERRLSFEAPVEEVRVANPVFPF